MKTVEMVVLCRDDEVCKGCHHYPEHQRDDTCGAGKCDVIKAVVACGRPGLTAPLKLK